MLPFEVSRELNSIKHKKQHRLAYKAQEVTQWLSNMTINNHPRLKCQPKTRVVEKISDDIILKCAIDIKDRVHSVVSKLLNYPLY